MAHTQNAPDGDCCICLTSLLRRGRQTLPCGHVLHEDCVREMRRRGVSGRCPLCREASDDLTPLQQLADQAVTFFLRKSWKQSYRVASDVLDQDPNNGTMAVLVSQLLKDGLGCSRDVDRAVEILETFQTAGHPEVLTELGVSYKFMGRTSDAEDLWKRASRSGNTRALIELGYLRGMQGRSSDSETFFLRAHQLGDERASTELGILYMERGLFSDSENWLVQGIRAGDLRASAWLGLLRDQQGRLSEAEALWEYGHRVGDGNASTYLGMIRLRQGLTSEAEDFFKSAVQAVHAPAATELGKLYIKQGRISDGRECLRQASHWGDPEAREIQNMQVAEPSPEGLFSSGTKVAINGLLSQGGRQLNGRVGFIVCHHVQSGRFGVKFAGEQPKSLKPENLIPITSDEGFEEIQTQSSIEASLLECERSLNSQVSAALLQSSSQTGIHQVLLITFSRKPDAFRQALLNDARLHVCRNALLERGFALEDASGAKVLVQPEQYNPLMEVMRLSCFKFASWHLFLDPSMESIVADIVDEVNDGLPMKRKFYQRSSRTVPLSFAATVQEMECKVNVLRTFIEIPVPSSMYSERGSSQKHTVSTTDAAEGRKGPNHRKYGKRRSQSRFTLDTCLDSLDSLD